MNYCIYKTINNGKPRVIHTITQEATHSHAKARAKEKLNEMWMRICVKPDQFHNAKGNETEFSYDFMLDTEKSAKARFYIAPAPKEEKSTLKK